jgi:hypothetical protein
MHEYPEVYSEKKERFTPALIAFLGIIAVAGIAIHWVAQVYAVQR